MFSYLFTKVKRPDKVVVHQAGPDQDRTVTCQLCGRKTPQSLRGTYDDRAPEVDHILPISKGGAHTYANLQCACRACNIAKGDTPMGQLKLFAA